MHLEKVKNMGLHEEPPKADDTTEKVDEEVPDEVEEQDEEDIDFDEDGNFSKSCDLLFIRLITTFHSSLSSFRCATRPIKFSFGRSRREK